jgi:DNA invertase Pin-like site-specific DNA recombinase
MRWSAAVCAAWTLAEFERSLILERQREGIALAKAAGKYKGRRRTLSGPQIEELQERVAAGERKSVLARQFGIRRETVYSYLRIPCRPERIANTSLSRPGI